MHAQMKAAILSPGVIRIEDRPIPQPGPGEVAVAVRYVGVCGSDLARFDGRAPPGPASVFGHEFSGNVIAAGDGADGPARSLGQPVTVAPLLVCGRCAFCLGDHEYLCRQRRIFGIEADGAMQEVVCAPAHRVLPLPAGLGMQAGALVEPLAVAVHAVRQAGDVRGASVVILGAGAIGILIAQIARAYGAERVVVMDVRPERLRLAASLGLAVAEVGDAASVGNADILFEATGAPAVANLFAPLLAPLGTIVLVGRMEGSVPIEVDALLYKEARLVTSRYFSQADFTAALRLTSEGRVPLAPLAQATVPFERLTEDGGRAVMALTRVNVRVLVAMPWA